MFAANTSISIMSPALTRQHRRRTDKDREKRAASPKILTLSQRSTFLLQTEATTSVRPNSGLLTPMASEPRTLLGKMGFLQTFTTVPVITKISAFNHESEIVR